MGTRGPIPKRSEDRIRRNKPDVEVDHVAPLVDEVEIPELDLSDPHPLISDFYESLKISAQTRYYEPSDWQYARVTLYFLDRLLKSGKPSGQMLATVNAALSNLMVSEGDRRRLRMEIERGGQSPDTSEDADVIELFRREFFGGQ